MNDLTRQLITCVRLASRDECPPDNKYYYCNHCVEGDTDCTLCWDNYLQHILNGWEPYKSFRDYN